jgi:hypothetical protein
MKIHDIAHARAGDKGDTSDLTLFAYHPRDFDRLVAEVTVERVRTHFAGIVHEEIECYLLPQLGAIKFVLRDALGGGVTRSLALDAHGKCYSSLLLDLEISADPVEARSAGQDITHHQPSTQKP